MNNQEIELFYLLKEKITEVYKSTYPGSDKTIADWKGQDITNFQTDLVLKASGQISEKWFYTHLKPLVIEKLPRVDTLNLLARYAGYNDWNDFVFKNKPTEINNIPDSVTFTDRDIRKSHVKLAVWKIAAISLVAAAGLIFIFIGGYKEKSNEKPIYTFCFIDADDLKLLDKIKINITLLKLGESPLKLESINGCFHIFKPEKKIDFIVTAPYYKNDTIHRIIDEPGGEEKVKLRKDDYALMIHYFSKTRIDDWNNRKKQLDEIISDDAMVFQLYNTMDKGMEMYNKTEFINKLTMPLNSLGKIEIIDVSYTNGKISSIRFKQEEKK